MIFADGTVVEDDGRTLHVGGHRFTFEAAGRPDDRARHPGDAARAAGTWTGTPTTTTSTRAGCRSSQQLRFAMTHHWGDDAPHRPPRRDDADPTTAPAALGLAVEGDPGARYAADVAGEHLTGEVWFRSTHQLGLTVDGWGPGLLVMADAPNGGGLAASATLTTYGPIDGDRAARWTGVWRAAYPD